MAFLYYLILVLAGISNLNARPQSGPYPPAAPIVPFATIKAPEPPIVVQSEVQNEQYSPTVELVEEIAPIKVQAPIPPNPVVEVEKDHLLPFPTPIIEVKSGPYPASVIEEVSSGPYPAALIAEDVPIRPYPSAVPVINEIPPVVEKDQSGPYPAAVQIIKEIPPVEVRDPLPPLSPPIIEVKTDPYAASVLIEKVPSGPYAAAVTVEELSSGPYPASVQVIKEITPVEVQDPLPSVLTPITEITGPYPATVAIEKVLSSPYPAAVQVIKEIPPVEVRDPLPPLPTPIIEVKTSPYPAPILDEKVPNNPYPAAITIEQVPSGPYPAAVTVEEVPSGPYPAAVQVIKGIQPVEVQDPLPPLPTPIIEVKTGPYPTPIVVESSSGPYPAAVTAEKVPSGPYPAAVQIIKEIPSVVTVIKELPPIHVQNPLPPLLPPTIEVKVGPYAAAKPEVRAPFVSTLPIVEPYPAAVVPVGPYPAPVDVVNELPSVVEEDPVPPLPFTTVVKDDTPVFTGPHPSVIVSRSYPPAIHFGPYPPAA